MIATFQRFSMLFPLCLPKLFRNFTATYKESHPQIPTLKKWKSSKDHSGVLISAVAQVYSHKALARVARRFVSLRGRAPPRTELEHDPLSWYAFLLTPDGYQEPKDCPSDKMLIALDLNTYVATPPCFTYRYAEGTTSVRSGLTSRSGNTTCSNIYSFAPKRRRSSRCGANSSSANRRSCRTGSGYR
eukprot:Selendium_serpulae@DN6386_c3_g1_i1.p1